MALPPPAAAPPMPPPGGPMGGAPPPAPDAGGSDDNVVCTICKNDDGSYMVYSGDEPEGGSGDMSGDDVGAMGPGGGAPASQGQSADSAGSVLKIVMDILQSDASGEGGPGNADSQFAAGFSADKSPTPVGMGAAGP